MPGGADSFTKWKAAQEAKDLSKKLNRKRRDRLRLFNKTTRRAEQYNTQLNFESLSISSTGWMGQRVDEIDSKVMKRKWRDGTIRQHMKDFQSIPFRSDPK